MEYIGLVSSAMLKAIDFMRTLNISILKFFTKKIAGFYWAYLKPAFDNYLLDAQRSKFLRLGEGVVFKGGGEIFHAERINIADYVHIGDNYFLMGIGGIEIGMGTIISRNVCIHSGNHDYKSNDYIPFNNSYDKRQITIGKGVWIGQNVNILPGVTIGDGAIIGFGVTLAKAVLPGEIIVNSLNRSIGFRDSLSFEKMLKAEQFISKHNPSI